MPSHQPPATNPSHQHLATNAQPPTPSHQRPATNVTSPWSPVASTTHNIKRMPPTPRHQRKSPGKFEVTPRRVVWQWQHTTSSPSGVFGHTWVNSPTMDSTAPSPSLLASQVPCCCHQHGKQPDNDRQCNHHWIHYSGLVFWNREGSGALLNSSVWCKGNVSLIHTRKWFYWPIFNFLIKGGRTEHLIIR